MQLITQVWDSERRRYVEDELQLCECLPSIVRERLAENRQFTNPEVSDQKQRG
jgi:hypothetical protein